MTNKNIGIPGSAQLENMPTDEQIQNQEYDLIQGLLKAAEYAQDDSLQKEVQIKRGGAVLFKFRVRPLSENELMSARKKATTYIPNPANKKLPPIEKDVDLSLLRSWKIYFATVPEDRKKIWENEQIKEKFDLIQGAETVDRLLTGGEKSAVADLIDNISGYDLDLTDYAKN